MALKLLVPVVHGDLRGCGPVMVDLSVLIERWTGHTFLDSKTPMGGSMVIGIHMALHHLRPWSLRRVLFAKKAARLHRMAILAPSRLRSPA